jgi:hypothetical protein
MIMTEPEAENLRDKLDGRSDYVEKNFPVRPSTPTIPRPDDLPLEPP